MPPVRRWYPKPKPNIKGLERRSKSYADSISLKVSEKTIEKPRPVEESPCDTNVIATLNTNSAAALNINSENGMSNLKDDRSKENGRCISVSNRLPELVIVNTVSSVTKVNERQDGPKANVEKNCGPRVTEYPHLKNLLKITRKRIESKEVGGCSKRERRKFCKKVVDHSERNKMRVGDWAFHNPTENPILVKSKPASESLSIPESLQAEREIPLREQNDNHPTVEHSNVQNDIYHGPRLVVLENGEVVLEEQSLVMEKSKENDVLSSEAINDNGTYSSYRKSKGKIWSERETAVFFKALETCGTDFSLMEKVFVKRSRRELKLKFKREERLNRKLVDQLIFNSRAFDVKSFDKSEQELFCMIKELENEEKCPKKKMQDRKVNSNKSKKSNGMYPAPMNSDNNSDTGDEHDISIECIEISSEVDSSESEHSMCELPSSEEHGLSLLANDIEIENKALEMDFQEDFNGNINENASNGEIINEVIVLDGDNQVEVNDDISVIKASTKSSTESQSNKCNLLLSTNSLSKVKEQSSCTFDIIEFNSKEWSNFLESRQYLFSSKHQTKLYENMKCKSTDSKDTLTNKTEVNKYKTKKCVITTNVSPVNSKHLLNEDKADNFNPALQTPEVFIADNNFDPTVQTPDAVANVEISSRPSILESNGSKKKQNQTSICYIPVAKSLQPTIKTCEIKYRSGSQSINNAATHFSVFNGGKVHLSSPKVTPVKKFPQSFSLAVEKKVCLSSSNYTPVEEPNGHNELRYSATDKEREVCSPTLNKTLADDVDKCYSIRSCLPTPKITTPKRIKSGQTPRNPIFSSLEAFSCTPQHSKQQMLVTMNSLADNSITIPVTPPIMKELESKASKILQCKETTAS